jgi:hypothetical protein
VTAQLHLAVHALTLQLLLKRAESLIDIIVADENLHKPTYLTNDGESPDLPIRSGDHLKKRIRIKAESMVDRL